MPKLIKLISLVFIIRVFFDTSHPEMYIVDHCVTDSNSQLYDCTLPNSDHVIVPINKTIIEISKDNYDNKETK